MNPKRREAAEPAEETPYEREGRRLRELSTGP